MTAPPATMPAAGSPAAGSASGPRRWAADLLLGARLALEGGRASWTRLVLTAMSVGMCVALLLISASIGPARAVRSLRAASLQPATMDRYGATGPALLEVHSTTLFSGSSVVAGMYLAPLDPAAPAPPGLNVLPGAGQLVLSPALQRLLDSPAGAGLRPRLDGTVVGTIGDAGLVDPEDLRFYRGITPTPGPVPTDQLASGWGVPVEPQQPDDLTAPVLIAGTTILIVPLLLLVAMSSRLGGAARDRRLAAMRLVGAAGGHIRRITTGEVLAAATAGLVIGAGGFLLARLAARWIPVAGRTFFPSDITPVPMLAVLIVVLVPLLAVIVALAALRTAIVEPLGVTRIGRGRPRRLAWRLLFLLAAGVAILTAGRLRDRFAPDGLTISTALVPAIGLAMICIPVFVPYLVEQLARRLSRGGPAGQIAIRRLQLDSGTAGRVCSGIAVVLAGAVALLPLLAYAADRAAETGTAQGFAEHYLLELDAPPPAAIEDVPTLITRAVGSATPVIAWVDIAVAGTDPGSSGRPSIVGCATVLASTTAGTCRDGDVFRVDGFDPAPPPAGTTMQLSGSRAVVPWQVPAGTRTVGLANGYPILPSGLLITPGALTGDAAPLLHQLPQLNIIVTMDGGTALDAGRLDAIRNSLAGYGWRVKDTDGRGPSLSTVGQLLTTIRAGLIVGGGLVLLVAALGLVVTAVEQITERRRALVMAVAAGVPRFVLARSLLIGAAIPAAVAFAVADLVGLAIPVAIQPLLASPLHTSLPALLGLTAAGLALVVAVTALALPALRRLTRPEALRTE